MGETRRDLPDIVERFEASRCPRCGRFGRLRDADLAVFCRKCDRWFLPMTADEFTKPIKPKG